MSGEAYKIDNYWNFEKEHNLDPTNKVGSISRLIRAQDLALELCALSMSGEASKLIKSKILS